MIEFRIRTYPDPVLRKKSQNVSAIGEEETKLINYMVETMYVNRGIGLAAPQVGVLKRIIVIDVGEGLLKMINPEINLKIGRTVLEEGCLSLPGRSIEIHRAETITASFIDDKNDALQKSFGGLTAKAIQHEIDHLNGKLIIDYLPWYGKISEVMTYRGKRRKSYGFIGEAKCLL